MQCNRLRSQQMHEGPNSPNSLPGCAMVRDGGCAGDELEEETLTTETQRTRRKAEGINFSVPVAFSFFAGFFLTAPQLR